MSIFSVVTILTSIFFIYFVIRNINKNKILFDQAAMWIILGFVMVFCAMFPIIPGWFSHILGFQVTSNFILFLATLLSLLLLFLQTIQLSKQKEDIKNLIQELSLINKQISDNKETNND